MGAVEPVVILNEVKDPLGQSRNSQRYPTGFFASLKNDKKLGVGFSAYILPKFALSIQFRLVIRSWYLVASLRRSEFSVRRSAPAVSVLTGLIR